MSTPPTKESGASPDGIELPEAVLKAGVEAEAGDETLPPAATLNSKQLWLLAKRQAVDTFAWDQPEVDRASWKESIQSLPARATVVRRLQDSSPTVTSAPLAPEGSVGTPITRQVSAAEVERFAGMSSEALLGNSDMDFMLREVIGRGGQAEIWRAWQASLAREVAVKRLVAGDPGEFLREAFTSAELDHPNIVPIHELGRVRIGDEDVPLIAMKLVRGRPWTELIREGRAAPDFRLETFLVQQLRILVDVCNAVAYAHSKKIIHRDLKPQQVMIGFFGEVFLMDWGLAISLAQDAPFVARQGIPKFTTRAKATNQCGSPAYMAPEQTVKNPDALGYHTDVYLLGAILYELVVGEPPHHASSAEAAFFRAAINENDPPPDACPASLRLLVERSLSSEPEDRPKSVEEFRAALDDYLTGAGRLQESREITERLTEEIQTGLRTGLDYASLTRYRQALARALQLWPENPGALRLQLSLIGHHAEFALQRADLALADAVAGELPPDDPFRANLLSRIGERRRELRMTKTYIRAALGVVALLLATLIFVTVRHQQNLAEAYDETLEERDRAHEMMSFMLHDMWRELQPIGRLDLLEPVAMRTLQECDRLEIDKVGVDGLRIWTASLNRIADLYKQQGKLAESLEAYQRAIQLSEELVRRDPDNPLWRNYLASNTGGSGTVLRIVGKLDDAVAAFERELAINTEQNGRDPDNILWKRGMAAANLRLAEAHYSQGDLDDTIVRYERARELYEEVARMPSADGGDEGNHAAVLYKIGMLLVNEGRWDDARTSLESALELRRKLTADDPDNALWAVRSADIAAAFGLIDYLRGENAAALRHLKQARGVYAGYTSEESVSLFWKADAVTCLLEISRALLAAGDRPAALDALDEALELSSEIRDRTPADILALGRDVYVRARRAAVAAGGLEPTTPEAGEAMLEELKRHVEAFELGATKWNHGANLALLLASTKLEQGRLLAACGRADDARAAWEAGVGYLEKQKSLAHNLEMRDAYVKLLAALGRGDEARPFVEQLKAAGWAEPEFTAVVRGIGAGGPATR